MAGVSSQIIFNIFFKSEREKTTAVILPNILEV